MHQKRRVTIFEQNESLSSEMDELIWDNLTQKGVNSVLLRLCC